MTKRDTLTPRQRRVIACLLSCNSIAEAATQANVSTRSILRWLKDTKFRAELSKCEGDSIDEATRRLIHLSGQAVDTLELVMSDEFSKPEVRLRAAQGVIDSLLRLRDLRNLESRIAALEEEAANRKDGKQ